MHHFYPPYQKVISRQGFPYHAKRSRSVRCSPPARWQMTLFHLYEISFTCQLPGSIAKSLERSPPIVQQDTMCLASIRFLAFHPLVLSLAGPANQFGILAAQSKEYIGLSSTHFLLPLYFSQGDMC